MTGMRRSEVVGLRWSDVQLDRHQLTVNQAVTVVDGEEDVDTPKSRRSRRVIDLDADTVSLMQRHRTQQLELYLRLGVTATGERPCLHQRDRRPDPPRTRSAKRSRDS